jgi:hypothetical protein
MPPFPSVAEVFASGEVAIAILAAMLIELFALIWLRRRIGHGPGVAELVTGLGAGASLLLALRASLTGTQWRYIAVWLIVALAAHVADLTLRWRRIRT